MITIPRQFLPLGSHCLKIITTVKRVGHLLGQSQMGFVIQKFDPQQK